MTPTRSVGFFDGRSFNDPHRRSAPETSLHRQPVGHDSFGAEQQQPGKQQIPPDALGRLLRIVGRRRRAVRPPSPPARPSAAAAISCGSIGVRSDSARSTLLATTTGVVGISSLRAELVKALFGQLEHLGTVAVERDARARRRQRDAGDVGALGRRLEPGVDDVADRPPRPRLAIRAEVADDAMDEGDEDRLRARDRSTSCRASTSTSTRGRSRPGARASAGCPSSKRASVAAPWDRGDAADSRRSAPTRSHRSAVRETLRTADGRIRARRAARRAPRDRSTAAPGTPGRMSATDGQVARSPATMNSPPPRWTNVCEPLGGRLRNRRVVEDDDRRGGEILGRERIGRADLGLDPRAPR